MLFLITITMTTTTTAQKCKTYNDCGRRQTCFQGRCDCISLFGIQGMPECTDVTPVSIRYYYYTPSAISYYILYQHQHQHHHHHHYPFIPY